MFSTPGAIIMTTLFILLNTTCICMCFTIIACVQILTFKSQRAIFNQSMIHRVERRVIRAATSANLLDAARKETPGARQSARINLTERVVRMTQRAIYGDSHDFEVGRMLRPQRMRLHAHDQPPAHDGRRDGARGLSAWSVRAYRCAQDERTVASAAAAPRHRPAHSKVAAETEQLSNGFTIYRGLVIALSCFFLSTVILIWIFLAPLGRWGRATLAFAAANGSSSSSLAGAAAAAAVCLDPTRPEDVAHGNAVGTAVSAIATLNVGAQVLIGWRVAAATARRYSLASLLALHDDDDDDDPNSPDFFEDAGGEHDGRADATGFGGGLGVHRTLMRHFCGGGGGGGGGGGSGSGSDGGGGGSGSSILRPGHRKAHSPSSALASSVIHSAGTAPSHTAGATGTSTGAAPDSLAA